MDKLLVGAKCTVTLNKTIRLDHPILRSDGQKLPNSFTKSLLKKFYLVAHHHCYASCDEQCIFQENYPAFLAYSLYMETVLYSTVQTSAYQQQPFWGQKTSRSMRRGQVIKACSVTQSQ